MKVECPHCHYNSFYLTLMEEDDGYAMKVFCDNCKGLVNLRQAIDKMRGIDPPDRSEPAVRRIKS